MVNGLNQIQKKELSVNHQICPEEKISVIPLGFDLSKFKENQDEKRKRFRNEWKVTKDEIAIGIIGRLVPIKDHHFFIDVIKSVAQKTNQKLRFFIIHEYCQASCVLHAKLTAPDLREIL